MPERSLYGTTDGHSIEIPPGTWRMVTFNRVYREGKGWQPKKAEPSILFGPCFYSATVGVRVRGLTRGQEFQIRLAHYREKAGGGWERSGAMPLSSPVHDGGSLHAVHFWQSHISGGRRGRVRVEVQHHGENPAVVDYARAESLYWPGDLAAPAAPAPKTHTVRDGDTLGGIAQEHPGVTWQQIATTNGLTSPYTIYPGDVLTIPDVG